MRRSIDLESSIFRPHVHDFHHHHAGSWVLRRVSLFLFPFSSPSVERERDRLDALFILISSEQGEFFNVLFGFSVFLSFLSLPSSRFLPLFFSLFPPPLRGALATSMRLIRSIGARSAAQNRSFFPFLPLSMNMLAVRNGACPEAPVASLHLSRNWRWWAFAPFPATAMRAGQEPTDRCRSGKSDHSLG